MPRLPLIRLSILLPVLAASAVLGTPSSRASCMPPAPAIVWSYPKDGDVDVPTNVTLWLLLSGWHRPGLVLLDGKEIPVNGFGFGYQPLEPMAPSSPHELTFQATSPGAAPAVTLTIHFTTASGETERQSPTVPTVPYVTASPTRPLSTLCQSVVHAMDCFDTGQDTHLVFATEAKPFLWVVERVPALMGESPVFTLWPGECDQPEVFLQDAVARNCTHQYRLHALEGTGLRAMSRPFCPAALLRATDGPDGGAVMPPDEPPPADLDAGVATPTDGPAPSHGNENTYDAGGKKGGCSF
ncbi:MAG TPA: hypothetical protein VN914_13845, partial [Polyangia bacterium]|nr:hypothetical protein [Polyangia bacterium]